MHHTLQRISEALQDSDHHMQHAHEIVTAMARDNLSYAQAMERIEHMITIMECTEKMIMHSYKHKIKSDSSKIDISNIEHWDR